MLKRYFIKSVLLIIVAVCIFGAVGCNKKTWDYNSEENIAAAENHKPFDGIKSVAEEYDFPEMTEPFKVIDVSAWQEEVDYAKVKESGVEGVIIRLARYNMDKDPYFDRNYTEAKKHGLLVGCYYFIGASNVKEAEKEAEKVIQLLDEKKYELELPVFYDVEDEHDTFPGNITILDDQRLTDMVKRFCDTLLENGYYAGFYCNLKFAKNEIYMDQLSKYPFWVARWSENNACKYPYAVWQYSASGSVPGVNGDCDVDLCFADFHTYIRANGYNNLKK